MNPTTRPLLPFDRRRSSDGPRGRLPFLLPGRTSAGRHGMAGRPNAYFVARGLSAVLLLAAFAVAQNRPDPAAPVRCRSGVSIVTPVDAPDSLHALVAQSPAVVLGTCEQELPGRLFLAVDPMSDIVTDRVVRIHRVLKGRLAVGTQIAVEELGGTLRRKSQEPIRQEIVDQRPLQVGQRYLLFLRPSTAPVGDAFDGRRLTITSLWAGSFLLEPGGVRIAKATGRGLRGLDGQSEVDVLARVQQEIAAAGR